MLLQARRRSTYRARLGVAAFGFASCLPLLASSSPAARPQGKGLFEALATAVLLLSGMAGLVAADAFSRERREGTMGLLLITRVTPLDLVAAKFASFGLAAVCALLALSPAFSVPLLLGGVTGGETYADQGSSAPPLIGSRNGFTVLGRDWR